MKKQSLWLVLFLAILVIPNTCFALVPFYHLVDFGGSGTFRGEDYREIVNIHTVPELTYVHDLSGLNPPILEIDHAVLSLMHAGNEFVLDSELWAVRGPVRRFIGILLPSRLNSKSFWRTQSWDLDQQTLNLMRMGDWRLRITLNNPTPCLDRIWVGKS